MQRSARFAIVPLIAAALGSSPPAISQDSRADTGWIDFALLAAGGIVLRTGKVERGEVTIDIATLIRASKERIWNILVECEIAPEYVPNVISCESIDLVNNGKSELFIQTVKPAFFVPRFEHVFRLDYFPYDRIDVHRVSGPIAEMEGSWRLLDQPDGSIMLLHSLRLQPGFPVPRVLVRATLRRDLPIVLDAVRARAEGREN